MRLGQAVRIDGEPVEVRERGADRARRRRVRAEDVCRLRGPEQGLRRPEQRLRWHGRLRRVHPASVLRRRRPEQVRCARRRVRAEDVRQLRKRYPGVPAVAYVNTYADVKAEVDICCTSSNANAVVESLHSDVVIFLPDEYLARNVAKETGRHIIFPTLQNPKKDAKISTTLDYQQVGNHDTMIGWHGRCEVHEKFTVKDIEAVRKQFPEVVILSHPECSPEVVAASDFSGGTNAMIRYVQQTNAPQYLVLTECAMGDNIAAANPEKDMLRLCSVRCPHMNQITLEDTLKSLQLNRYVIDIPEYVRVKAARAVERMIAIG